MVVLSRSELFGNWVNSALENSYVLFSETQGVLRSVRNSLRNSLVTIRSFQVCGVLYNTQKLFVRACSYYCRNSSVTVKSVRECSWELVLFSETLRSRKQAIENWSGVFGNARTILGTFRFCIHGNSTVTTLFSGQANSKNVHFCPEMYACTFFIRD